MSENEPTAHGSQYSVSTVRFGTEPGVHTHVLTLSRRVELICTLRAGHATQSPAAVAPVVVRYVPLAHAVHCAAA